MSFKPSATPNFDPVARPYRWLEYLVLGNALERCRFHFLPQLDSSSHALVLGDGDGRFLARLLAANPNLSADAVDTSAAMLALLRCRCAFALSRTTTHHTDAISFLHNRYRDENHGPRYDLVVSHFFLDCLDQSQVETLSASIAPQLACDGLWLVSDFRIPPGAMKIPSRILVRSLYFAFRILTGLQPTRLPDHDAAITAAGLTRIARRDSLFGLLTTELWTNGSPFRQSNR